MRLGQLARKLSLRPAQIVEYLASNNIQIEDSSNARMEDSHVTLVAQHFAPGSLEQIVEETEEVEEVVQVENYQPESETETTEPTGVDNQPSREPDVIRVPKIELSGLKVLGKIELPESKKKETNVESEGTTEPPAAIDEKPAIEGKTGKSRFTKQKPKRDMRERNQQRPWKNPLELQREREAREAEEKKRLEIEREKDKRKRFYEEKVKVGTQPKKTKGKAQPEIIPKRVDTRPVPKTWLGKFLRWWTT